jgi:nicotinamidase-related amidase
MGCQPGKNTRDLTPNELIVPKYEDKEYMKHKKMLENAGLSMSAWGEPIGKDDVLLVIDMQNDFIPQHDAPDGGRFGVLEGGAIARPIVDLITRFSEKGALVVACRDYHPHDHCSFSGNGGPFPPHCVQGSAGSFFFPPIGAALHTAMHRKDPAIYKRENSKESKGFAKDAEASHVQLNPGHVEIAFKGFAEMVDSFGIFKYTEETLARRAQFAPHCTWAVPDTYKEGVTCAGPWSGGFCLKSSSLLEDINAPPDVMAIKHKENRPLDAVLKDKTAGRLLIVGLAQDVCVTDSAINASQTGFKKVFIALDATRSAHVPGVGQFDGYLTDPAWLIETWKKYDVQTCEYKSALATPKE